MSKRINIALKPKICRKDNKGYCEANAEKVSRNKFLFYQRKTGWARAAPLKENHHKKHLCTTKRRDAGCITAIKCAFVNEYMYFTFPQTSSAIRMKTVKRK